MNTHKTGESLVSINAGDEQSETYYALFKKCIESGERECTVDYKQRTCKLLTPRAVFHLNGSYSIQPEYMQCFNIIQYLGPDFWEKELRTNIKPPGKYDLTWEHETIKYTRTDKNGRGVTTHL